MLLTIPQVLTPAQLDDLRSSLREAGDDTGEGSSWVDGRATAGYQGAPVKFNQQIDERSDVALHCQQLVLAALAASPLYISAVLPNIVYPPMFNRYGAGMTFGPHIDGSVRVRQQDGRKIRTDVSATLFLSGLDEYDGGELEIEDTYGRHQVRLAAGDMVIYPATSLHQVRPVTRGERLACFFWVESLIRDATQRRLLFDMDNAIQRLNATGADEQARSVLIGCYHNLVRQWAET